MIGRCYNPNDNGFANYGARGIEVCDRWRFGEGSKTGFECFLEDMGRRPSLKHSIDRTNNDGNYEPTNCRWASSKQQNRNRRDNFLVLVDGRHVTLTEAAEQCGLKVYTLRRRLVVSGWPLERALMSVALTRFVESTASRIAAVADQMPLYSALSPQTGRRFLRRARIAFGCALTDCVR
jgi:hypothetical protein